MRRRARYTRQRAKKRRDGVECDRKLKISPQETISSRSSVPSPPWHHAIGNVQRWPLGKHRLPLDAVLARLGSRSKTVRRRGREYVQGGPSASGKIYVDIKFKVPSLAWLAWPGLLLNATSNLESTYPFPKADGPPCSGLGR